MTSDPSPRRGELRIHLGAAPGVGKTYAALNEARRRLERGTDVVVGLVETHGRARTAELLEGLEVLPRAVLDHRGTALTELDVDAVLARAPEVCVVDELAHSCAPGSRHAKRWEDVEELLAAGIDVISTVNVQHLESLGDVVERITGVRQRETIPDAVVRAADQIELVDITPEALRRRMAHGNIYRPEKIDASLAHYFRTGNLIALRELALLWVADQVDVALQRYRSRGGDLGGLGGPRAGRRRGHRGARERDGLRRAARIARRAGSADLLCVHVLRSDGLTGPRDPAQHRCRAAAPRRGRRGVVPHRGRRRRPGGAARVRPRRERHPVGARHLAALAVGAGVRPRDRGPDDRRVRHHRRPPRHPRRGRVRAARRRMSLPARRHAFGWPAAVLLPVLATVIGVVLRESVDLSTDVVLFFLATVVTAMIGGLAPALVAALGGGLLLNVFLTPPLYTLSVAQPENAFAIGAMVVVALLVAAVVDRADRRTAQATTARAEATLLTSFARVVLSRSDPLPKLLERVREAFGLTTVALMERGARDWEVTACTGDVPCRRPAEADVDVEIDEGVHLVGTGRTLTATRERPVRDGQRPGPARAAQPADGRRGLRTPSDGPTPRACGPPCSRPSGTTCGPR